MRADHLYNYAPYHYSYEYDYIFTGAGAAGLSLIMRMLKSGAFDQHTFLLVDADWKRKNDRTWCFWEESAGFFDDLVCQRWNHCWFHSEEFSKKFDLSPYQYKMIRGIDFYQYCFDYIKSRQNVRILHEPVEQVFNFRLSAGLTLANGSKYYANSKLFNSIPFTPYTQHHKRFFWQHFKGWVIETAPGSFDADTCTLMDFRVPQTVGSSFVYTMPLSDSRALVEYTIFSEEVLAAEEDYDLPLQNYIREVLKIGQYKVLEREKGKIPMSDFKFRQQKSNIIELGTAGGQTKGSTGYTFSFIQRHSDALLAQMKKEKDPSRLRQTGGRFHFYDRVMLAVMQQQWPPGAEVYRQLFARNPVDRVFRFLDNQSSFGEELKIFASLPKLPFLKASISATFA